MNIWAVSNMPVYSSERRGWRRGGKASKAPPAPPLPPQPLHNDVDMRGLLDPAMDGPPSPESIRALSKQMRRASVRDKHQSHHTTSSGSSSLRSLASADRPPWDNAAEGTSLSRKSSGRSTASSMPRERPESVQIFGKTFFGRRGKLRRESSAQSSSETSLYSADTGSDVMLPPPPTSMPTRESTIPGLFGRRRAVKQDPIDDASAQRKFMISGPYNFQHVTHTQKDHLPDAPTSGALRDIRADDLHFNDFSSSDSLHLREDDEQDKGAAKSRPPSGVLKSASPPRRLLKHTRSQEQLSMPPPRPPRSPIEQSFGPAPPIPPPRVSSRMSSRHDGFEAALDRPRTAGGGFRHPQPLTVASEVHSAPFPATQSYFPAPDMDAIPEHGRPRVTTPPDDTNWPLPSVNLDAPLPDLPEEDENTFVFRRSRASVTSNSSLRGSQSVPMLRALSIHQEDGSRRRSSGASDTLGRLDLFAAQRALKAAMVEASRGESVPQDTWEDDIDYCYEHAAEADCDYAWDRPSLDISRDCDSVTPVDDHSRHMSCEASPAMLTPGQFDIPALSPVSQLSSVAGGHEAITPTALSNPKASNFSLPRVDSASSKHQLLARKLSDGSFRESHGFTLSPSLLIPFDYQQQMLAAEIEILESPEISYRQYEDSALTMDPSALLARYRTSASTTGTFESSRSGFEKHTSTTSTASTDYSRLTLSTSSIDMETYLPKTLHRFPSFENHSRAESKGAMPTLNESDETLDAFPPRREFASRGSESNLVRMATNEQPPNKWKDSILTRRQRARTTSLSTPPPPNQYALFPSKQMNGNRI
ncbi:hypothetical protein B0H63DRAFT_420178 [Podospora didyma]|uniref:CRIB domain-containing protein n=1 Tax=Podospora didyma TaxID=330526 RepID=A0AAE0KG98_9PEZI|nr:hypothetical protein B0H63DRAFT_420178 [Podospora didyma]